MHSTQNSLAPSLTYPGGTLEIPVVPVPLSHGAARQDVLEASLAAALVQQGESDPETIAKKASSIATAVLSNSGPVPQRVVPNRGKAGTEVDVVIFGDLLSDVVTASLGRGIHIDPLRVITDGILYARLHIDTASPAGWRTLTLTDSKGNTGALPNAFYVKA